MRSPLARRRPSATAVDEPERSGEIPWSLARFVLTLAIVAWAVRSLIVAPFSIPSGSMLPTLFVGDYLVVAKWPYGYSRYSLMFGFPPFEGRVLERMPQRGDVVVFHHPSQDMDLIKRVIGLPGDSVEVRGGEVILNGRPLPREPVSDFHMRVSPNSPCKAVPPAAPALVQTGGGAACSYPAFRETLPNGRQYLVLDQVAGGAADTRAAVRVPAGHVLMMGDNRDDSLDSRFSRAAGGVGLVPVNNLIGRALTTFWSTDGSASYFKPWTWFTALRGTRIGNGYSE